jgi:beta-galactosidase
MIKKAFTFLMLCIFCSVGIAQDYETRTKNSFNNDWEFLKINYPDYEDIINEELKWDKIRLPHDWSIKGEFAIDNLSGPGGGFLPCGTAWYKKGFTLDASQKNKKIFVQFDGVYMNSEVWINGHFLGLYPYGYSTFQYDLTPYLQFDNPNIIAVRVDNSLQPSSRWYTGSGIYRNVWLITINSTHFVEKETFVNYQNVTEKSADIHLKYAVKTDAYPETDFFWWRTNPEANTRIVKNIEVISALFDNSGKKIHEDITSHQLQDFSQIDINQKITVNNPKLWSASEPDLYELRVMLNLEGKPVDELSMKIGIRSIEYDNEKGLLVNGKSEKLKGVCLHQDAGSLGVAVPKEIWRYRLNNLKEMGCNAIRPSHHPFAPEFYDLCDEMGFYIMDEAFDEWRHGSLWGVTDDNAGKVPYGYHKYFDQWAKTDLTNMILRDRNHPSVIMYSIGNEIPDQRKEDGTKTAKYLLNICHALDSTRLVTAGVDFVADANPTGFLDALDIAGYNYVGRFTHEKMYEPEREKYPERLFLGTETYHDTYYWLAVRDNPYVIGEFIWSGYDYLGEGRTWPIRGWDGGVIDLAEYKRPEYYLRKAYWADEPVVHIAVQNYENKDITEWHPRNVASHWNWNWKRFYLTDVYVYSNSHAGSKDSTCVAWPSRCTSIVIMRAYKASP